MTREELREHCKRQIQHCEQSAEWLREEPQGRVYEEHKLILELLDKEQFMNKPCISAGVCEHDKTQMLENLRAEIKALHNGCGLFNDGVDATLKIIDKYRTESKND